MVGSEPAIQSQICPVRRDLLLGNDNSLLRNGGDLGNQRLVNDGAEVKASNARDETELELLQLQGSEVELVEDTEVGELEEGLELLELEDGVQVEDVVLEQALESQRVEVVVHSEGVQELKIQGVDDVQVLNVNGVEVAETVQERKVDSGTGLNLLGGGGNGESGESASEDTGELHFDVWKECS